MEISSLNEYIRDHHQEETDQEIAARFGVSAGAVRSRRGRMGLFRESVEYSEKVSTDIRLKRVKDEVYEKDKKYRILLEKIEEMEDEMGSILELWKNVQTFKIEKSDVVGSEAVAFLVASDWHVEERVTEESVNGLNDFDLDEAKLRAMNFFRNGLRLVKNAQRDIHIDTIVLPLLGDFISGSIHDELMESNELRPIEAAIYAESLIVSGIEFLLQDSSIKTIIVPCHSGNHGRITPKRRISTENGNSLEYFMYCHLRKHFETEKRVRFFVGEGYHSYLDVFGTTVRMHHGHNISFGGGVGGPTIPINKAIAQWNKIRRADLDVFGHFHQFMDGGNFIANGSLIGFNAYAVSIKASYEAPRQAFFLIDKKRGKTIVAPIFLQER